MQNFSDVHDQNSEIILNMIQNFNVFSIMEVKCDRDSRHKYRILNLVICRGNLTDYNARRKDHEMKTMDVVECVKRNFSIQVNEITWTERFPCLILLYS